MASSYRSRLVSLAKARGWELDSTRRSGHGVLRRDGFGAVWCSLTPKDPDTALRRVSADLDRAERSG